MTVEAAFAAGLWAADIRHDSKPARGYIRLSKAWGGAKMTLKTKVLAVRDGEEREIATGLTKAEAADRRRPDRAWRLATRIRGRVRGRERQALAIGSLK
jgi:hypothetical protein